VRTTTAQRGACRRCPRAAAAGSVRLAKTSPGTRGRSAADTDAYAHGRWCHRGDCAGVNYCAQFTCATPSRKRPAGRWAKDEVQRLWARIG